MKLSDQASTDQQSSKSKKPKKGADGEGRKAKGRSNLLFASPISNVGLKTGFPYGAFVLKLCTMACLTSVIRDCYTSEAYAACQQLLRFVLNQRLLPGLPLAQPSVTPPREDPN